MYAISQETLLSILTVLAWPIAYFTLFGLLAKIHPSNKDQRLFRKGFATDLVYWFVMPIFYTRLAQVFLIGLIALFFVSESVSGHEPSYGLGLFFSVPFIAQFFIALFIRDFFQYWIHRLFHMQKMLWPFHSVHHSTTEMDWLSSARTHPVDGTALLVVVSMFVYLLGFSPEVFLWLGTLSTIYNTLIHANLDWTYGPLRYVFVSPVFHRWHHTSPEEGGDKNFAPTFAFLDLLFGTYYMPQGAHPSNVGTADPVPTTFFGQILYPFKARS